MFLLFHVHRLDFPHTDHTRFDTYSLFIFPKMILPVEILDVIISFLTQDFRASFQRLCHTSKHSILDTMHIKTREQRIMKERNLPTRGRSIYQFMRDETTSFCKTYELYIFRKWREMHRISKRVQLISWPHLEPAYLRWKFPETN